MLAAFHAMSKIFANKVVDIAWDPSIVVYMQTTKPILQRVYMTLRDPASGESKSFTLYGFTFPEALAWLNDHIAKTVSLSTGDSSGGDDDEKAPDVG